MGLTGDLGFLRRWEMRAGVRENHVWGSQRNGPIEEECWRLVGSSLPGQPEPQLASTHVLHEICHSQVPPVLLLTLLIQFFNLNV